MRQPLAMLSQLIAIKFHSLMIKIKSCDLARKSCDLARKAANGISLDFFTYSDAFQIIPSEPFELICPTLYLCRHFGSGGPSSGVKA